MRARLASGLKARAAAVDHLIRDGRAGPVVATFVAVQLIVAAWFTFATPHNGFVWYSGGDATEYWMPEFAIGHLLIPQTLIGWGLPVFYGWVPRVAGPALVNGLPVVIVLQLLVLLPLSVALVWAVANRLFGRAFAFFATAGWLVYPIAMVVGFRQHAYREAFEQHVLAPHWFGLTNMADFPSLVGVLACAWAGLRTVDGGRWTDACLTGTFAGVLVGLKPANAFILPALVVLFAARRSPRLVLACAAAFAPALLTLAIWKWRGLGYLPATSTGVRHEALGGGSIGASGLGRYATFDLRHLGQKLRDLQEVFWSVRLLEFLAIAGALGAVRRDRVRGLFLVVWFVAFVVVKGSSPHAQTTDTTFFRLTLPGAPAFVLLAVCTWYLVPGSTRGSLVRAGARALSIRGVALAVAVLTLVPLIVVSVVRLPTSYRFARDNVHAYDMPLSDSLAATVTTADTGVRLSWRRIPATGAHLQYVVLRADPSTDGCTRPPRGALECFLAATPVTLTDDTAVVVPRGPTYRIGAAANDLDVPNGSDLMLLGPPVRTG